MDTCAECGYSYESLPRDRLAPTIRAFGSRYADAISLDDAVLREHPFEGMWSVLEYACHVRDVLRVQRERIRLALSENGPTFASMRREERAVEERYNEQSPARVGAELSEAAAALALTLEDLDEEGWQRTGVYNWPQTRVRKVEWIARHTIHEGEHHLMDIERLIGALQ